MRIAFARGQAVSDMPRLERKFPHSTKYIITYHSRFCRNYGPSLIAQEEARSKGYDQILWIFDKSCQVTEAGASNFFVIWRNKETNRLQLITAPLDDRIILDGVTRRSVLELAKDRLTGTGGELEGLEVIERTYTMADIVDAHKDGRFIEAFAAGTAVCFPTLLSHILDSTANV